MASATTLSFRPAVRYGDILYLSGVVGCKDGRLVGGDLREELLQAIENIRFVLEQERSSLSKTIRLTVLLVNEESIPLAIEQKLAACFGDACPAKTVFTVNSLPFGARIGLQVDVAAH